MSFNTKRHIYASVISWCVHDISAWLFAHVPTQCIVLFGAGISAVSSLEKFHVMMWSIVALLISSSDALPIRSLLVYASDWINDPSVLWINWNWLSTFSKWDFVEMEYPVRGVAAFKSPPMILCHPSDFFISAWMVSILASLKVRPSRALLLDGC